MRTKRILRSTLLAVVAITLVTTLVLAYSYRAAYTITEDTGTAYGVIGVMVDSPNTWLAANGFMSATARDTQVETLGGLLKPHMVATDKILTATTVPANSQTNLYFTTGDTGLADFDVITGYNGYITIDDDADLELDDTFELEWTDVYLDTAVGADKSLITKGSIFEVYVSALEEITASFPQPTGSWTQVAPQLNAQTQIPGLTAYNGKLYGCTNGGRLFEWNDVNAWVQVAPQLGGAATLSSLKVYNGKLYAGDQSTGNLLEWNDVNAWVSVAPQLVAENIYSLEVYDNGGGEALYGGTGATGQLYQWNDVNAWVSVAPQLNAQTHILSLEVYDNGGGDALYGGTLGGGRLFQWNDANAWAEVAPQLNAQTQINGLAVHNGKLYGGTSAGGRLFEWNDVNAWVQVAPQLAAETQIIALLPYNGRLYGGTGGTGLLYLWNDANAWTGAAAQLLAQTVIKSLAEYGGTLYGGTFNLGNLFEFTPTVIDVVAVNVVTGEYSSVVVTADGVNLELSLDGAVAGDWYDTQALAGASVANTGDDWLLMYNNTTDFMPYMAAYEHTTNIGGYSLKAWYQPATIVVNTSLDVEETAGGSAVLITDAVNITQAIDYWVGALVTINVSGAPPPAVGETSICTSSTVGTITVSPAFSAALAIADELTVEFGTLVDRQGGDENARLTWGVMPAGVDTALGGMVSGAQPTPGAGVSYTSVDYLPGVDVSDWYEEPAVAGSLLTNPLRPFVTIMSENTDLIEIQGWRLLASAIILLFTVSTAIAVRSHQLITGIVAGAGVGVAVALTIFPFWTLVFTVMAVAGGVVAERSPTL